MAISKVILNGETLMDVTSDTVESSKLLTGETATKNDGTKITGSYSMNLQPLTVKSTSEEQVFDGSPSTTEINGAMLEKARMDSGDSNALTSSLVWRDNEEDTSIVIGQKYHLSGCFGTGDTEETRQRIFFDTDWVARETPVSIPFTTKPGASDDDPSSFDGSIEFTEIKLSSTEITITATAPFVVFTGLAGFASENGMYLSVSEIGEACDGYMPVTVKPMRLASLSAAIGRDYYADNGQIVLDCSGAIESITDQIDCDDSQLVEGEKYRIKATLRDEYNNNHYIGKFDSVYITWDSSHTIDLDDNCIVTIEDGKLSCNNVWPYISLELFAEIDGWDAVSVEDAPLQSKTVSPSESAQTVTADSSYYGLDQVTVNAMRLQEKTVTPTELSQVIIADDGELILNVQSVVPTLHSDSRTYMYQPSGVSYKYNDHRLRIRGLGRVINTSYGTNIFMIDTVITFNLLGEINLDYTESNGSNAQLHITRIYKANGSNYICFSMQTAQTSSDRSSIVIDDLKIYDLDNDSNAYTALKQVTVEAIPSSYVIPSGTYSISSNGTYDIRSYQSVDVSVEGSGGISADDIAMKTISGAISGEASRIYTNAFYNQSLITTATFPNAELIYASAFAACGSLTEVSFPNVTSVMDNGFASCRSLTSVYMPKLSHLGSSVFIGCSCLSEVNFPSLSSIGSYVFASCIALTTISFPSMRTISMNAFQYCSALRSAYLPNVTSLSNGVFNNCYMLSDINISQVMYIYESAFTNCSALTTIDVPSATIIGSRAFSGCVSLSTISIPKATKIYPGTFMHCENLSTISLPAVSVIYSSAFQYCYRLLSVYLLYSSIATLSASTVFSSTPLVGYYDHVSDTTLSACIYVPSSLYSKYISANNWSFLSSRIVSI